MSASDVFKQFFTPTPTPTAATPPVPGTPTPQPGITEPPTVVPAVSTNTAPNGVVPADSDNPNAVVPADVNAVPSPLDQYKELWQTAPIDPNAPTAPTAPTLDSKQLAEKVGTINFANTVTPEQLTKITAGGEGAAEALVETLNTVARQVMLQSTLVNNKLSQQVAQFETGQVANSVPDLIKQHAVASNLHTANPVFSNPAVKPLIDMAEQQLRVKNPQATAAELTKMAQDYVSTVVQQLTPTPSIAIDPMNPAPEDWSKFG